MATETPPYAPQPGFNSSYPTFSSQFEQSLQNTFSQFNQTMGKIGSAFAQRAQPQAAPSGPSGWEALRAQQSAQAKGGGLSQPMPSQAPPQEAQTPPQPGPGPVAADWYTSPWQFNTAKMAQDPLQQKLGAWANLKAQQRESLF